jgi:Zn-dependent peptidase ImmA (M78 family)
VELLYSVILKQQWYRELLLEEGRAALPFVGKFNTQSTVDEVSEDIRATIGINDDLRRASVTWEDFLRRLVILTERAGVLVLRSSIVGNQTRRPLSVDEFRGFAISDQLAPCVFINGRDAKTAQIFTLVHEIAHVWLGASGISNPDFRERPARQANSTERLCNAVAAEVLVPRARFRDSWNDRESITHNMVALATAFRVSTVVVLRQAYDLDLITQEQFFAHLRREQQRWNAAQNRTEADGGNFYASLRLRNSAALTEAIVESAQEGKLLRRDAARLLSLKVPTFEKLSARLFE